MESESTVQVTLVHPSLTLLICVKLQREYFDRELAGQLTAILSNILKKAREECPRTTSSPWQA